MDLTPFHITLSSGDKAEIRPCCREDNVVDYAVWLHGKLAFTVTKDHDTAGKWVVALKNADDQIDDRIVQEIGTAIETSIKP